MPVAPMDLLSTLTSRFKLTRNLSGKKIVESQSPTGINTSDVGHSQTSGSSRDIPIVATLKFILQLCETAAELAPYTGVKGVIKEENVKEIENLAVMLSQLEEIISPCQDDKFLLPGLIKEQLAKLSNQITSTEEEIDRLLKRKKILRFFLATADAKAIAELSDKIEEMIKTIMFHTTLHIARQINGVEGQTNDILDHVKLQRRNDDLNAMLIAHEAWHGANDRQPCLERTRTKIIEKIESWRRSGSAQILCLSGASGTGKTSIACSVAKIASGEPSNAHFADFFCSSSLDAESNAMYIFPTIAHELAKVDDGFYLRLKELQPDLRKVCYGGRQEQFRKLLLDPLKAVNKPIFLVIDGLDECKGKGGRDVFRELTEFIHEVPLLKVLISCSSSWARDNPTENCVSLSLDNDQHVSSQEMHDDMRRVLKNRLRHLDRGTLDMLTREVIKNAERSFMLASAICDDPALSTDSPITREAMDDLKKRLASGGMDALYRNHVQQAMSKFPDQLHQKFYLALEIAISPISIPLDDLARLLDLKNETLLDFFHAFPTTVLSVHDRDGSIIRVRHVSFEEYLNSSIHYSHYLMVRLLLRYMCHNLKRNSKNSRNFFPANELRPSSMTTKLCASQALAYACRYWPDHFLKISITNDGDKLEVLLQDLENFMKMEGLRWLEVVVAEEFDFNAQSELTKVRDWFQEHSSLATSTNLQKLLTDILESLSTFSSILRDDPLQIYHSFLLPLTPSSRRLSDIYTYVEPTVGVSTVSCHHRDNFKIDSAISEKSKLVLSHRGKYFAVLSPDAPVEVWGTRSKKRALLENSDHAGNRRILDAVFLGDERMLVLSQSRGSFNLRLWNIQTLANRPILEEAAGTSLRCPFLTLSSDGNHVALWRCSKVSVYMWARKSEKMEKVLIPTPPSGRRRGPRLIALCSRYLLYDSAIFDLKTGTEFHVRCDLEKATCCCFHRDGKRLVIGGHNEIVLYGIREHANGSTTIHIISSLDIASTPKSLMFSSKGSYIICTGATPSEAPLTVWRTSPRLEQVAEYGRRRATNENPLAAVASQENDRHILSVRTVHGSTDVMLEMFDLEIPVPAQMLISALAFSSDGLKIASGSKSGVVAIWNARMNEVYQCWDGPEERHSGAVSCVSFSSDGNFVASTSQHRLDVRLLSAMNSGQRCLCLTSSYPICSFSENSSHFAALYRNEHDELVVNVWDTDTWDSSSCITVRVPVQLHSDVHSIAISNRGDKCAFSDDYSLFICSVPLDTSKSPRVYRLQPNELDPGNSSAPLFPGLSFVADDRYLFSKSGCIFEIAKNLKPKRVSRNIQVDHLREVYIRPDGWIVDEQNNLRCWIPWEIPCRVYASHESTVVFCTPLGSVLILSVPPLGVDSSVGDED